MIKMGKTNKTQSANKKIYSLDEMDEVTLERFQSGTLQGMYTCHKVISDTLERLKLSLEDVWAIEYSGVITPAKEAYANKLSFAIDALTTLEDSFQGAYDTKLSELKAGDIGDYFE
jgi:hypothetical protein